MRGSPVCLIGQEAVEKLAKERKLLLSLGLRLAELFKSYLMLAELFRNYLMLAELFRNYLILAELFENYLRYRLNYVKNYLRLAELLKNCLRIITSVACLCGNSYLGCLKS